MSRSAASSPTPYHYLPCPPHTHRLLFFSHLVPGGPKLFWAGGQPACPPFLGGCFLSCLKPPCSESGDVRRCELVFPLISHILYNFNRKSQAALASSQIIASYFPWSNEKNDWMSRYPACQSAGGFLLLLPGTPFGSRGCRVLGTAKSPCRRSHDLCAGLGPRALNATVPDTENQHLICGRNERKTPNFAARQHLPTTSENLILL